MLGEGVIGEIGGVVFMMEGEQLIYMCSLAELIG